MNILLLLLVVVLQVVARAVLCFRNLTLISNTGRSGQILIVTSIRILAVNKSTIATDEIEKLFDLDEGILRTPVIE